MEKSVILLFAKEFLKEHRFVDEYTLQSFIRSRPEVDKLIRLSQIQEALDDAYVEGKINLYYANEERSIYVS